MRCVETVVRSVGFSPVKGMRHLALDHVDLDELGAVGDRAFCLVDPEKQRVLRTVQHPELIGVVARAYDGGLALALPSGEQARGPATPSGESITCDYWGRQVDLALTDGTHAALVSEWLGLDVRLARAPRGAVVFADPITVITTASVEALGELVQPARFRATLVVETDEPWVEDTWLGRELTRRRRHDPDRRADPAVCRHRPPPRDGGEGCPAAQGPRQGAADEQGRRADVRRLRHGGRAGPRHGHALTDCQSLTLADAAWE